MGLALAVSAVATTASAIAPPATSGGFRVVRSLSAAADIQSEWAMTVAASAWPSPIQDYVWARTYAEVYGAERRLHILTSGNGRAAIIAPLFRPKGLFKPLELIGVKELFEVMDFIYAAGSDLEGLAAVLVERPQPIVLRRIRADSPALAALRRMCAREWITFCRPSRGCPFILLDETWGEPERHVNAGRRSDLRRARRAAEKMGSVTWEILEPSPDQVPTLLDEAYAVEAASWKGREQTAMQIDARLGEFYRRYAAIAAVRGTLRICFLRIDGKPAAMQIAVVSAGGFWLLKIGYTDEFARCSPGILLMIETIRYAAAAGLRSYEFLGASETWIRNWTPLEHECVSFRAYPLTVRGLAALAGDATPVLVRDLRARAKPQ